MAAQPSADAPTRVTPSRRPHPPGQRRGVVPAPDNSVEGPRRSWAVLGLMLAAQFMVILDISVVNVALPSIGADLALTSGQYQWLVSAYVLLSGGLLLLGGRLADLFRRRSVFATGLATFTLASLVSGLAGDAVTLIVARAAQGAGAALLTPAALAIIMTTYSGRQRATALSVWGAIGSTGIAAGVLLGGALTTLLSWEAVFFVNVPIGLAVLAGVLRTVPAGHAARTAGQLDLPGAAALVSGLLVLVYAIEGTQRHGWTAPRTLLLLGAAAALLGLFSVVERRAAAPLVPPSIWRVRSLVSASTIMAGVTGAVTGVILLTSLYLQRVVGSTALEAGLQFLPLAAAITVSAAVAGKLLARTGPRATIVFGLVAMSVGAVVLFRSAGGVHYLSDVLPGLLVLGAGIGPMFVAISVAAMSDVTAERSGLAGGLMMTGHEVGAALGVATLTAVGPGLLTAADITTTYAAALLVVIGVVAALLVVTVLAVPARAGSAAADGGHGAHGAH